MPHIEVKNKERIMFTIAIATKTKALGLTLLLAMRVWSAISAETNINDGAINNNVLMYALSNPSPIHAMIKSFPITKKPTKIAPIVKN